MRKEKKLGLVILSFIMCVSLFMMTGCGKSNTNKTGEANKDYKKPVTDFDEQGNNNQFLQETEQLGNKIIGINEVERNSIPTVSNKLDWQEIRNNVKEEYIDKYLGEKKILKKILKNKNNGKEYKVYFCNNTNEIVDENNSVVYSYTSPSSGPLDFIIQNAEGNIVHGTDEDGKHMIICVDTANWSEVWRYECDNAYYNEDGKVCDIQKNENIIGIEYADKTEQISKFVALDALTGQKFHEKEYKINNIYAVWSSYSDVYLTESGVIEYIFGKANSFENLLEKTVLIDKSGNVVEEKTYEGQKIYGIEWMTDYLVCLEGDLDGWYSKDGLYYKDMTPIMDLDYTGDAITCEGYDNKVYVNGHHEKLFFNKEEMIELEYINKIGSDKDIFSHKTKDGKSYIVNTDLDVMSELKSGVGASDIKEGVKINESYYKDYEKLFYAEYQGDVYIYDEIGNEKLVIEGYGITNRAILYNEDGSMVSRKYQPGKYKIYNLETGKEYTINKAEDENICGFVRDRYVAISNYDDNGNLVYINLVDITDNSVIPIIKEDDEDETVDCIFTNDGFMRINEENSDEYEKIIYEFEFLEE